MSQGERRPMDKQPILCLDFDGVCHSYTSGWQGAATIPDAPVPGLWDFLSQATLHFDVQVYSSRTHQDGGRVAMINWFGTHAPYAGEMSASESHITWYAMGICLTFPLEKPPAMLTLDDRALLFTGAWPDPATLLRFRPWHAHE